MKKVLFIVFFVLFGSSVFAQNQSVIREEYFPNGELKLQLLEVGNDLIQATYFHENGLIAQKGFFKNKKLFGYWETFDVEQNKISSGFFSENIKIGMWNYWKDEEIIQIISYSNNSMVAIY